MPEPNASLNDFCISNMDTKNANEIHKWNASNCNFSNSMAELNLRTNKGIDSPNVSLFVCGCKTVCVCASCNSASNMSVTVLDPDSELESETDSNLCDSCASKKGGNSPEVKFSKSSNFASRLQEICFLKQKSKSSCAHDINMKFGKQKCKKSKKLILNMEYYEYIMEIYFHILLAKDLNDQDFLQIIQKMKILSTEGLVTDEFLLDIEKTIKDIGYLHGIKGDGDHLSPDKLKYFNSVHNKLFSKGCHGLVDSCTNATKDKFPDVIVAKFMEPVGEGDVIESKLSILACLYLPKVLENMENLDKDGLLTKEFVIKYKKLTKLADNLIIERNKLIEKIQNYSMKILDGLVIKENGEIYYDVEYRTLPLEDYNRDLIGVRACMSKHKTPFCEMCGFKDSWLNTFKKRGIHIKEADKDNNKHIWHNCTNDK